MIFKRFSFLVSLRVLLILVNIVLFAIIFGDNRLFFNQIILLIVLAIQVYDLIRYVNKTNRDLSKFLLSIKQKDYAINFSDLKSGRSFRSLYSAFDEIINSYQKVKIEKEAQFHFLLTLIEHINVGIISIEGDDDIGLYLGLTAALAFQERRQIQDDVEVVVLEAGVLVARKEQTHAVGRYVEKSVL